MSYAPFDVNTLLEEVHTNGKNLENESARRKCLLAAQSLFHALETPREAILRLLYAEISHQAAIRSAIELDLFRKLDNGSGRRATTDELADSTGSDPQLLARLLKHLAAMGTIYESDADQFLPTRLSKALTQPMYSDGFPVLQEVVIPPISKLHEFLSSTNYRNPEDAMKSPFQFGMDIKDHYFTWMQEHPNLWKMFNNHMTGTNAGTSSWMDEEYFSLEENLVKGTSTEQDAIFFVDVGGGNGHDVSEMCRRHPDLSKPMVLQDLSSTVKDVKNLDTRIKVMAHDFFQEQPVKGARAYHMHRILHDWPDDKCCEILAPIKSAMTKGYSKLLINEMVIPDKAAPGNSTGLDLLMMTLFAARERTEQGWKTLLESAGFRIVKIWPIQPETESLIEAELA